MLEREIREAINRASAENESNTPDSILAAYLMSCLKAFNDAVNDRDRWYGISREPGNGEGRREKFDPFVCVECGEAAPDGGYCSDCATPDEELDEAHEDLARGDDG